ncbi:hypothetical protein H0H93_009485 [Arthromyces matolae]|nr:hypothetical protein H0H93_009485 [Arthromyces matolae]
MDGDHRRRWAQIARPQENTIPTATASVPGVATRNTTPTALAHRSGVRYKNIDPPVVMPSSFGSGIEKVGMRFGSLSLGRDSIFVSNAPQLLEYQSQLPRNNLSLKALLPYPHYTYPQIQQLYGYNPPYGAVPQFKYPAIYPPHSDLVSAPSLGIQLGSGLQGNSLHGKACTLKAHTTINHSQHSQQHSLGLNQGGVAASDCGKPLYGGGNMGIQGSMGPGGQSSGGAGGPTGRHWRIFLLPSARVYHLRVCLTTRMCPLTTTSFIMDGDHRLRWLRN